MSSSFDTGEKLCSATQTFNAMSHLDFLTSAVKYEQVPGYFVLAARSTMCISQKTCSLEIMEMWPRLTSRYRLASGGISAVVRIPYYKIEEKQGSQYSFLVTLRTHFSYSPPPP
jgi:hypothetical protein